MIIVKIVNQKIIQVAVASQPGLLLKPVHGVQRQKFLVNFARSLTQSTSRNQKVTSANHQQLIPVARSITFRQSSKIDRHIRSNSNAFAITGEPGSQFISADLESSIIVERERESPLEALKRRAREAAEKRERASKSKYYGQIFNEAVSTTSERRLVILLSWLEAKEKHIEKYRQFYLDRGFDVLNVKTSPYDLLLPGFGTLKIAKDFVRFMKEKDYSDVVLHGFSVGGYMFGEFLIEIDQQEKQVKEKLINSIKGLVFDSLVPIEGTCIGVANSITRNKILAKAIENILRAYLYLGQSFATKYYMRVSKKVWGGPLRCPSLFLMSKDDIISDHRIVRKLSEVWRGLGIETYEMLVDSSPHVQIFNKHHERYVNEVETFLKKIKLEPI